MIQDSRFKKPVVWFILLSFSLGTFLPARSALAEDELAKRFERERSESDAETTARKKIESEQQSIFGGAVSNILFDERYWTPTAILLVEIAAQVYWFKVGRDAGAIEAKLDNLRFIIRVLKDPKISAMAEMEKVAVYLRTSGKFTADQIEAITEVLTNRNNIVKSNVYDDLLRIAFQMQEGLKRIKNGRALMAEGFTPETIEKFSEVWSGVSADVRAAVLSKGVHPPVPPPSASPTRASRFLRSAGDFLGKAYRISYGYLEQRYRWLAYRPQWLIALQDVVTRKAGDIPYSRWFWHLRHIPPTQLIQLGMEETLEGYTLWGKAAREMIGTFERPQFDSPIPAGPEAEKAALKAASEGGKLVRKGILWRILGGKKMSLPHPPDLMKTYSRALGMEITKEGRIVEQVNAMYGQIAAAEAKALTDLGRAGETLEAAELVREARVLQQLDGASRETFVAYRVFTYVWNTRFVKGVRWAGKGSRTFVNNHRRAVAAGVGTLLLYMSTKGFFEEDAAAAEAMNVTEAGLQSSDAAIKSQLESKVRASAGALLLAVETIWEGEKQRRKTILEKEAKEKERLAEAAKKAAGMAPGAPGSTSPTDAPVTSAEPKPRPETEDQKNAREMSERIRLFDYYLPIRYTVPTEEELKKYKAVYNPTTNRNIILKVWNNTAIARKGRMGDPDRWGFLDPESAKVFWGLLWEALVEANPKLREIPDSICYSQEGKQVPCDAKLLAENTQILYREGKDLLLQRFALATPDVFANLATDGKDMREKLRAAEEQVKKYEKEIEELKKKAAQKKPDAASLKNAADAGFGDDEPTAPTTPPPAGAPAPPGTSTPPPTPTTTEPPGPQKEPEKSAPPKPDEA